MGITDGNGNIKPGIGNGNETLGMGGNGIEKDSRSPPVVTEVCSVLHRGCHLGGNT